MDKGIKCHYPAKSSRTKIPAQGVHTGWTKTVTSPAAEHPPSVRDPPGGSGTDDVAVGGALDLSDQELASVGGDFLDWDDSGISFADFLNTQTFNAPLSPESSALSLQAASTTAQTYQTQEALSFSSPSIPRTPTVTVRILNHRPKTQLGTQRTANTILHSLKSYPLMIQRHNDLPPFIHNSLVSSSVENSDMETLTNCLSLVQMLNGSFQASRRLFWKNVRMECERLSAEV